MYMFPIIGDVNFDCTVKMISVKFLYYKDTVFFFLKLISILWGDSLRLCKNLVYHHIFTILF